MATTNLFSDPAFRDGAFTSNDPRVRAYALQKTMRAMDLGVELGAGSTSSGAGARARRPTPARTRSTPKRFRDALNFLCEYVRDQGYDLKFALEAKPNEPRGDIFLPTTGAMLASSTRWTTRRWWASTPRWRTSTMAGLNFRTPWRRRWDAGKLFHIDLNDQARPLRPGLPLRRAQPQEPPSSW
jgi:xylose isomerase